MCHHYESISELSAEELDELLEEHSVEELRAEHSDEELQQLGITA